MGRGAGRGERGGGGGGGARAVHSRAPAAAGLSKPSAVKARDSALPLALVLRVPGAAWVAAGGGRARSQAAAGAGKVPRTALARRRTINQRVHA
jgi:hypothetical protein